MQRSPLSTLDITVVIPTYNRARLVRRALDSVRQQTRAPASIVVVDDASSDRTAESVEEWSRQYAYPVQVHRMSKNAGPAAARNRGIRNAATRYVGFLDSDDEYLPAALEQLVACAEANRDAVVSFADATVVTPEASIPSGLFRPHVALATDAIPLEGCSGAFRLVDATRTLLKASIIPTSATCFLRDAALAVGGMPEEFKAGEDWLFWLRMATQGSFVFVLDDLVLHHRHDQNLTGTENTEHTLREKLRGYLALERGLTGVTLTNAHRAELASYIAHQAATWRYALSRLGSRAYARGLRSEVGRSLTTPLGHVIADPRAVLRAAYFSVRGRR